jgi:hypothetical protein
VGRERPYLACAFVFCGLRVRNHGASGVNHVVHEHHELALHVSDDFYGILLHFARRGTLLREECYDVDKDRYSKFKEEFFSYYHLFAKEKEGKYSLNLNELNVQQLIEAGIGITNISSVEKCTSCEKDDFYSFRRDSKEDFGEMLSYVIAS